MSVVMILIMLACGAFLFIGPPLMMIRAYQETDDIARARGKHDVTCIDATTCKRYELTWKQSKRGDWHEVESGRKAEYGYPFNDAVKEWQFRQERQQ